MLGFWTLTLSSPHSAVVTPWGNSTLLRATCPRWLLLAFRIVSVTRFLWADTSSEVRRSVSCVESDPVSRFDVMLPLKVT